MTVGDISVVIPLFNGEDTIERALQSVQHQDAGLAETIVIDDGSTDNGAAQVAALQLPGVHLVRQAHEGVATARNHGIAIADTPWVAFLDADDEWKPGFLSAVMALAGLCPHAALVATAYEEVRPGGDVAPLPFRGVPEEAPGDILADLAAAMVAFPPVSSSSCMVRRDAVAVVGAFPEGEALAEDWDLWVRIALHYPVAFTPAVHAVYHQECCERASQRQRFDGRHTALLNTLQTALANGEGDRLLPDASLRALLNKHRLEIAKHQILAGKRREARDMIAEAVHDGADPIRCLRWWLRSIVSI